MTTRITLVAMAASMALGIAAPVAAQDTWPTESGDYVEVAGIKVDDGHGLDYANHLAGMWRKGQEFAKAQGWITSYEILTNVFARENEPDLYLVTRFPRFADPAESSRRDEAYRAYMQATEAQMQASSGERAKYRHQMGTMLLREERWKK